MRLLLRCSVLVLATRSGGALEQVAFEEVRYQEGDEAPRETWAARWSFEGAEAAAARFCEAVRQGEGCIAALAPRLRPDLAAKDAPAARLVSRFLDADALLSFDGQVAVVAALAARAAPKLLVFGSGRDSPLLCAAALHAGGTALFLEQDPAWARAVAASLDATAEDLGVENRCRVQVTLFEHTTVAGWLELLGREAELAAPLLAQLPADAAGPFDVVLVDGPAGYRAADPGRATAIAAAGAAVDRARGVVFVDDVDRLVERVFANSFLRPKFDAEGSVRGTDLWPLRWYSSDPGIPLIFPPDPSAAERPPREWVGTPSWNDGTTGPRGLEQPA
ncbi:hypothetical protein M885DRAFT_530610 [Pelagophyceae sp. CCMP2097]|nr:hypothetical protein M885DRAFT_530610 [Pelagophyceae sp. CCMP2097]